MNQQASPRGISKSIKHVNQMLCNISVQVRKGEKSKAKTLEHNKVLTSELMSCLSNPRLNKQRRVFKTCYDVGIKQTLNLAQADEHFIWSF